MSERIWDRYLGEQDRAHVATVPRRQIGFGKRPALLLIDLYRWVFGDEPQPLLDATRSWTGSCGLAGWQALPAIQELLAAARAAAIPVVYTTGLERSGMGGWSKAERSGAYDRLAADPAGAERRRRMFDIVDEVAPMPGELVLRKASPSCFWGTPLIGHLNALGVDTLIVGGESTSGCVRASVVDGCSNRYRMIVVEECVFDRHEASHAINLFDMDQKYADVVPLADALGYLRTLRSVQRNGEETPEASLSAAR